MRFTTVYESNAKPNMLIPKILRNDVQMLIQIIKEISYTLMI